MKRVNLMAMVACTGFLTTAAVVFPGTANADVKRLAPSAFCHPEYSATTGIGGNVFSKVRRVGSQLRAHYGFNTVVCGYPSDSGLFHNHVNQIRVRGFRGNNGDFVDASAKACVGSFGGTQHCGYQTDFGDGGYFSVLINDISEWSNAFWYPYLSVKMRPGDRLYGIVATD